jgi:lysophospholipase L1-like esterase
VLECGVRLVAPQDLGIWTTTRDGLVLLQPEIERTLPSFGRTIRTNALGFRDRDHPVSKPPGVFRVVLLGDSFMEALQVDFEDSFAHRLEGLLSEGSGRTVEVVNAGVSGWGTDDQLTWLERHGLDLAPDLVVVAMTLHNDVSDNLAMEFHVYEDGRLRARPYQVMDLGPWLWLRAKIAFATHSQLYRFVVGQLTGARVERAGKALNSHMKRLLEKDPDPRIAAGWAMTEELLGKLVALSRASGASAAVFLIPINKQLTEPIWTDFLEATGLPRDAMVRDRPEQVMRQWGRRTGVPVIDLLPVFDASLSERPRVLYLPQDGHWNADAHHLAAEAVAGSLLAQGLVPRAGS